MKTKQQLQLEFSAPESVSIKILFADLNVNQKINYRAHPYNYYGSLKGQYGACTCYNVSAEILGRYKFDCITEESLNHARANNPNQIDYYIPVSMWQSSYNEKVKFILSERQKNKDLFSKLKRVS